MAESQSAASDGHRTPENIDGVKNSLIREKLMQWGLSQYIEIFEAQAIDEKKFLTITSENVKELIPIVGHRLDFLEKRRDFFKSHNLKDPDELFCGLDDTISIASLSDTNSTISSASTAESVETAKKSNCGEQLRRLLDGSPKGQVLLQCTRLTSHDRKKLCDIIVDHLMIAKDKIKTADWQFWTTEITAVFIHEQAESYYTPYRPAPYRRLASGKLWDKYCNVRRYIRGKLTPAVNVQPAPVPDEIRDALARLRTITPHDRDLDRLWRLTSSHRKNDGTITEYYNTYPILSSAIGASLLEIDFEEAHLAHRSVLISSWHDVATTIIKYAKERKICEDLFTGDQATVETLGFLVLPFLFRTNRVATKRGTNWRPSQPEVAKSFIVQITTAGDFERQITERRNNLAKYGITVQPFVLTVGSRTSYDAVYVVVNDTKYECSSLMGAVDLCFKVIWALRAEYQRECEPVWNFLQRFVYKIQDNTISNKNSQVIQTLWSDLQGHAQENTLNE